MAGRVIIQAFFDEPTNTVSYLVPDPASNRAAVIDPVLDYDHSSGEVDTRSVDAILRVAVEKGCDRLGTGDPRARRPSLRVTLCQGENRRPDRHRRAYQ